MKAKKISTLWFGIPVRAIALSVFFASIAVSLLLFQQADMQHAPAVLAARSEAGISSEMQSFGDVHDPIGSSPSGERMHCIPRPACLDATPRCLIAEPSGGWCNLSGTPIPEVSQPPHGCFYRRSCTTITCPSGVDADECYACKNNLTCPGNEVHPSVTCIPRPTCAAGEACPITEPDINWCPQTSHTSPSNSSLQVSTGTPVSTIGSWWNGLIRSVFH